MTLCSQLPNTLIHNYFGRRERDCFDEQGTTSVALIGHPNMQNFSPIPLNKRETNVLTWIHRPMVATINQRETLVATINKRNNLMHIYLHNMEHPVITFPIHQEENPSLMHISINNMEHPTMTFYLNKREHPQTIL